MKVDGFRKVEWEQKLGQAKIGENLKTWIVEDKINVHLMVTASVDTLQQFPNLGYVVNQNPRFKVIKLRSRACMLAIQDSSTRDR